MVVNLSRLTSLARRGAWRRFDRQPNSAVARTATGRFAGSAGAWSSGGKISAAGGGVERTGAIDRAANQL